MMKKTFPSRPTILALALALLVSGLMTPGALVAQEEAAEEAATPTNVKPADVTAFLGYWMLNMELNGNEVKMGLEIGGRGDVLLTTLVSPFGELAADNFRRDGEKFGFDLNGPFGQLMIDTWIEGTELHGHFANDSGELAADFIGEHSDRLAFQRFLAPDNETRITKGEEMVRLRFARPTADGPAFGQVESLKPGEVVQFTDEAVMKLTTDFDLQLGELAVPTENVAPDYPGVYGLWLKRTDSGWNLVVNQKPDVWGTQYDSGADLGEVPLEMGTAAEPSERLMAKLEEGEAGSRLSFTWGPHTWSAPIAIVTE
jgi:hypothetical protein